MGSVLALLLGIACGEWDGMRPTQVEEERRIVASIAIEPAPSLKPAESLQLELLAWDEEGEPLEPPAVVEWSSGAGEVAEVSSDGKVTAVAPGEVEIVASARGLSASVVVSVVDFDIVSLTLEPEDSNVRMTETVALVTEVRDETGALRSDLELEWFVSEPEIAALEVTEEGATLRGLAPGTVEVVVSHLDREATATVKVRPLIALIEVEAPSYHFVNEVARLEAKAFDDQRVERDVPIEWSVSDPSIAFLTHLDGLHGKSPGDVLVTASAGGGEMSVWVKIRYRAKTVYVDVATKEDRPIEEAWPFMPEEIYTQQLLPLRALATDVRGRLITEPDRIFTWSSSDPELLSVDQIGDVIGKREGEVRIRAEIEGAYDEVSILVKEIPLESIHLGYGRVCGLSPHGEIHCTELGKRNILQPVPSGVPLGELAIGSSHACGLTEDGEAYCFGRNEGGALGNGTTMFSDSPIPVETPLRFTSISTGTHATCAISTETGPENTYCWGRGRDGQLGLGNVEETSAPLPIAGKRFKALSLGDATSCGVDEAGKLWCWGDGSRGQLGNGSLGSSNVPVAVASDETYASVAAWKINGNWSSHTPKRMCALTTAGAIHCWGDVEGGSSTPISIPTQVEGQWKQVLVERNTACGLSTAGEAFCWGPPHGPAPTRVAAGHTFETLHSAEPTMCGTTAEGSFYCWGGWWPDVPSLIPGQPSED